MTSESDLPKEAAPTPGSVIASLALGIVGFVVPFVASIPGLILGILGLRKIRASEGRLKGQDLAVVGITVSGLSLLSSLLLVSVLAAILIYFTPTAPVFEETGGYTMLCEVESAGPSGDELVEQVCIVLRKRLDPSRRLGILIRPHDNQRIKIHVPVSERSSNVLDRPEDLIRMVQGAGILTFRILPTDDRSQLSAEDIKSYRERLEAQGPVLASTDKYVWSPIRNVEAWYTPGTIVGEYGDRTYVLASNLPGETMLRDSRENRWSLDRARPTLDQMGRHAVAFELDARGGLLFADLTGKNIERPLSILLDDVVLSAPFVQDRIFRKGVIVGAFTAMEVQEMANRLNAGSLPAVVRAIPETVEWTSPGE